MAKMPVWLSDTKEGRVVGTAEDRWQFKQGGSANLILEASQERGYIFRWGGRVGIEWFWAGPWHDLIYIFDKIQIEWNSKGAASGEGLKSDQILDVFEGKADSICQQVSCERKSSPGRCVPVSLGDCKDGIAIYWIGNEEDSTIRDLVSHIRARLLLDIRQK